MCFTVFQNHVAENYLRTWVRNAHDIVSRKGEKKPYTEEYIYITMYTQRCMNARLLKEIPQNVSLGSSGSL